MNHEKTKIQFGRQVECARKAGIWDKMFLAFGSLLGAAREGTLIGHDDDMDVGFLGDEISAQQQEEYRRLLGLETPDIPWPHGCREYRDLHSYVPDSSGKYLWMSIQAFPPGQGWKCCNWFFFTHAGIAWHAKDKNAKIKGCPADFLEMGPEIEFLGQRIRVPRRSGAWLDWCYPDWSTPRRGGNSDTSLLLSVLDWKNRSTWRIM